MYDTILNTTTVYICIYGGTTCAGCRRFFHLCFHRITWSTTNSPKSDKFESFLLGSLITSLSATLNMTHSRKCPVEEVTIILSFMSIAEDFFEESAKDKCFNRRKKKVANYTKSQQQGGCGGLWVLPVSARTLNLKFCCSELIHLRCGYAIITVLWKSGDGILESPGGRDSVFLAPHP